jgi:hypothetical protein
MKASDTGQRVHPVIEDSSKKDFLDGNCENNSPSPDMSFQEDLGFEDSETPNTLS